MNSGFRNLSANKRKSVLLRSVKKAVGMFHLFEDGDRVLIAVSGGKDSLVLLDIFREKSPWWARTVEFIPVFIDSGFSEKNDEFLDLKEFSLMRGMELYVVECKTIAKISFGNDRPQNPCFICSRLRRKALIETADKLGANKIALGHHRDDVLATFLINAFYGRQIAAIRPNQSLFSGKFHLIRPLFLARETQIRAYADAFSFPDLSRKCSLDGNTKRDYIKKLLDELECDNPGLKRDLFRALFHPKTEYLLGDYAKKSLKL
ncbi:tRNA 2-thiocytidine(32) synthetase TtcA [bacterium]|nr:tRNA 2-thiocytidine(32) synthetase TtcA [bacterium]